MTDHQTSASPERIVLEFGGSGLADRAAGEAMEAILRDHLDAGPRHLLVVHSPGPGPGDAPDDGADGEEMAGPAGADFLRARGLDVHWLEARELLPASSAGEPEGTPEGTRRPSLAADRDGDPDPALAQRLDAFEGVVLTGGGSESAAAVLAARWGADRLEIWSDHPAVFTADPRRVPGARLVRRLSYDEAQEITAAGNRILHPRCIPALRRRGIPIHLRSIRMPADPGTVVHRRAPDGVSQLKAVSWKEGVVLISMDTVGMWREVGFLARVFAAFADAEVAVDLVSTSETNVTVSLDASADLLDPDRLDDLVRRLEPFCRVELIRPCATVSLVGDRIRGMLHRLSPALRVFQEQRIHMVSQAANDLSFTVVVDADQGERLARQLHRILVTEPATPGILGPSWQELVGEEEPKEEASWWEGLKESLLETFADAESAYVYHLDTVRKRAAELASLTSVSRVLYAMKANSNPAILRAVHGAGLGFECVSRGEIERVQELFPDLDPGKILFTPNFAPREEYALALEWGVQVTLDALHPLVHWAELFRDRELFIRVDPGQGAGHHEKVSTAGSRSKFGLHPDELDELVDRAGRTGVRIVGLHVHAGSGIPAPDHWPRMARFLLETAERFPDVRVLDLGGGLPVPQAPGEARLDLADLDRALKEMSELGPGLELWLEPGRFLVAEAGVLLARVTQTKVKENVRYVGLATGMNSFIRPALYGSHHEIVNLTRLDEPRTERVQVVGPICETGDRLGMDRMLPPTREGDLVLIADAGAYGRAMASEYNLRPPAPEFTITRDGEVSPAR